MAILTKPSALGLHIIKLLEGLPEERLQSLAMQCKWRRYEPEQLIISRDGADRDVHLIVSGTVRITIYPANGRQVTFNDERAGAAFGDLAALDGKHQIHSNVRPKTTLDLSWVDLAGVASMRSILTAGSEG